MPHSHPVNAARSVELNHCLRRFVRRYVGWLFAAVGRPPRLNTAISFTRVGPDSEGVSLANR